MQPRSESSSGLDEEDANSVKEDESGSQESSKSQTRLLRKSKEMKKKVIRTRKYQSKRE